MLNKIFILWKLKLNYLYKWNNVKKMKNKLFKYSSQFLIKFHEILNLYLPL
jgi:hypothetical protein